MSDMFIVDHLFVTSKNLTVRKPLSNKAKVRGEYFKTHKITFIITFLTQSPEAIIIKEET